MLASSPELIEEVRKAPDDVLSMNAAAIEVRNACSLGCLTFIHHDHVSFSSSNIHWTYWIWRMDITWM